MEALAACFYICGHPDWAEHILSPFSYGEAFIDINESLLKRYAACSSEEDIKKAEEAWLDKIEREYAENRAERAAATEEGDQWRGGNMNRKALAGSDDEDDNEEDEDAEEERDPYDLPPESDDEEEMAELRRRVLASKPFSTPKGGDDKQQEKTAQPEIQPPKNPASDRGSGSEADDGLDDEFDDILKATPVTDRTGITAKERMRAQDSSLSATYGSKR